MQAEAAAPPDVSEQIVAFKRSLAPRRATIDDLTPLGRAQMGL